jgi:enoyl-CoA hydratase/carnithine racemase
VAAEDPVLVDVGDDGVAVVTLNRPEHRNAWNPVLEKRYFEVLEDADRDSRVRVVIVTGAGKTFCPGVDSGRLDTLAGRAMDLSDRRSPAFPWATRKPIIAAINGACAGMGLMQALLCDVRFAARGARFTTAFARRGLAAGFGISWLLPRLIGAARAADLLLSGRVFDADEAFQLGLVNRVLEPAELMSTARAYASDLAANCSPLSLALIRHQLHVDQHNDFETAIRRAYHVEDYALQAPDFREGMDSFLQKRAPRFHALDDAVEPAEITQAGLPEAALIPAHATSH